MALRIFIVVSKSDAVDFQQQVNYHLATGYVLHGEMLFQMVYDVAAFRTEIKYVQALILKGY